MTDESDDVVESLRALTVKELKDICRLYSISGYSKLRKAEIIKKIARTLSKENLERALKGEGPERKSPEEIEAPPEVEKGIQSRQVDNRTYLTYLLPALNKSELKEICRDFQISGYSKYKKMELIEYILDFLSDEEMLILIKKREYNIISNGIQEALNKIQGKNREHIKSVDIVNPDRHEVEVTFKGFNWEVVNFLSITEQKITNPLRDCDCRVGANMGFCSHFWVSFIVSLKEDFFQLEDWTLTAIPSYFQTEIEDLKLEKKKNEDEKGEEGDGSSELTIVDPRTDDYNLLEYVGDRITVYEAEIEKMEEKKSEYQGRITIYYIATLKDVEYGPQLRKGKEVDKESLEKRGKLLIRLSEKKYSENQLEEGDKISCNGGVRRDNFFGIMLKRVTKVEKL
ncbi:MAG: Rho termination factor N-terminal domain-containing protein [Promethearchaeia archaeon]